MYFNLQLSYSNGGSYEHVKVVSDRCTAMKVF